VAADLAAQAEHGEGTVSGLVTDAPELARAVGQGVVVGSMAEALAVSEAFAPEHLALMGSAAEAMASRVRRAGCVFVGGGVAFGDYVAGSNHALPTGGAARFASGLSARVFLRRMAVVRIGAAAPALARAGAPVARAEGFVEHARSMEIRQDPPA
jgi:histidinol dehydrogenase